MSPQFTALTALVALATCASAANFLTNGLAVTPQMGWNNWNTFGCDVNEDLLVSTARHMDDIGLKAAGYNYVILDDCWSEGRYPNRTLRPDMTRFPNGMAHVADRVHELGMKYGMYSSAGAYTCAQYAGSLGFETEDATTWASWGVDYLKYDNCYNNGQSGTPLISYTRYAAMAHALNATGRPMIYGMCNWGEDSPWNWAATVANSYRISGDITDSFDKPDVRCPCTGDEGTSCTLPGFHCSIMNILNKASSYPSKSQPGSWGDLDMLEVGNGGMSDDEYILHFTMWAAVKSPLIIGADVRKFDANAYSIYTNPAVLAVNQDPLGSSVVRRWRYFVNDTDEYGQGEISLWTGDLWADNVLVVMLNAGNASRSMNTTLDEIFVDGGGAKSPKAAMAYDVFDLWGNRMDNETSDAVLSTNSTVGVQGLETAFLNVTTTSYAQALAANDTRVLGKMIGGVEAHGRIEAEVKRHSVVAYRLRPRRMAARDEL